MPISYKRKNSMKKSKSSKGSKSSKLSKRVKTPKNTKPKKRLTRKSKNGSVVRKMRGGDPVNPVISLLNKIISDDDPIKQARIENIMNKLPENAKSNVNEFFNYFNKIFNDINILKMNNNLIKLRGHNVLDVIDIHKYYDEKHIPQK